MSGQTPPTRTRAHRRPIGADLARVIRSSRRDGTRERSSTGSRSRGDDVDARARASRDTRARVARSVASGDMRVGRVAPRVARARLGRCAREEGARARDGCARAGRGRGRVDGRKGSLTRASAREGREHVVDVVEGRRASAEVGAAAEGRGRGDGARASTSDTGAASVGGASVAALGVASALGVDLQGPGSVITALGVLAVIITVHECGHFFAARAQGIHVNAFAVGFGPNLFTYRGPEVEYSLKAIPLGGFVAFPDDDENCPYPEDDPDLLRNRPTKDRALVVSAGIIANVLFAFAILFNQVSTVGLAEQKFEPGVVVKAFTSSSVAREAGIEAGDIILSVDGEKLPASGKSVGKVVNAVKNSPNELMKFELMHIGASGAPEVKVVELRPGSTAAGEGKVGVKLEANASVMKRIASNPLEAVMLSGKEFGRLTALVWNSLAGLFTNFNENKSQVSGPIAIVATGAEVMRNDISGLYQFAAVININLAIVNLLPLPALDGGFLLLIAIEAARGGKKIPVEIEQAITGAGVAFLFVSGASLIVRDAINLLPH